MGVDSTMLRLQPVEHETVHCRVVELGVGRAEQLAQAERRVGRQRRVHELGRRLRRVVVGSAVRGSALPPLVVVAEVAQRGRLVAVAVLLLEDQGARLGARRVSVRAVPAAAAPAALVLATSVL